MLPTMLTTGASSCVSRVFQAKRPDYKKSPKKQQQTYRQNEVIQQQESSEFTL